MVHQQESIEEKRGKVSRIVTDERITNEMTDQMININDDRHSETLTLSLPSPFDSEFRRRIITLEGVLLVSRPKYFPPLSQGRERLGRGE
jgi:hypothetical protein